MVKDLLADCVPFSVKRYVCFPYEIIQSCRIMHATLMLVMRAVGIALVRMEYLLAVNDVLVSFISLRKRF